MPLPQGGLLMLDARNLTPWRPRIVLELHLRPAFSGSPEAGPGAHDVFP